MEAPSRSLRGRRSVRKLRPAKALVMRDSSTVAEACRRMVARHLDVVLLNDADDVLCGIFTDRDLVTRVVAQGLEPDQTPLSTVMTRSPVYVLSDALADDALRKMVQGKFRHLPVVQDGQVVAVLDIRKCLYDAIVRSEARQADGTPNSLLGHWESLAAASSRSVEALRSQAFQPTLGALVMQALKPSTASPSDTVAMAAKKMLEFRTDYVVVVGSGSKPQGIFTSKDLLYRVVARGLFLDSTTVQKVMTTNVEWASLDTMLPDALHMLHDSRFCHLPTVDPNGDIVGCVGILELMEATLAMADDGLSNTELATEGDEDGYSDVSAKLTREMSAAQAGYPSLFLPNLFSFKVQDQRGCIHRFNSGAQSLEDLVSAVSTRIGSTNTGLHLLYKDDEGDLVLISSDHDLALAVSFAKAFGRKALRLYVDHPAADGPSWRATLHTTVIASILVIVGLGILLHAPRPGEEPLGAMLNRLLSLKGE